MPRIFNRVITFHVEGEIYDSHTTAEDIIKNYLFEFRDYCDGRDHFFIEGSHKDVRGRITKATKLPKIHRYRVPDTELFMI